MKFAFCLPKYFPYGGLQNNFLRIATLCQQRDHKIVVYTLAWEGAIPEGFSVHVTPVRAVRNHARNRAFIRTVGPLLDQGDFDAVIGFMKMPGLDIYYAADPCFQARAQRDRSWLYRVGSRYRHFVACERSVFHADGKTQILMLTAAEIANYVRYYQTPRRRFHLLPPGIRRDRMAPDNAAEIRAEFRRKLTIGDDENLVLMVGSGFKTKGVDRTLRALASMPATLFEKTHLRVVGEGNAKPFQRLAQRLGVNKRLRFMGGREDVTSFLLGADLLIHPPYTENTGTVLLEAIVSGLPVLTTANCGWAFHVARAEAGKVVPTPFRQAQLNVTLTEMLTSPDRPRWSKNGIAYGRTETLYSRPEVATDMIMDIVRRGGQ